MNKAQRIIGNFPPWILTIVTVVAILWLTLAPRPLGGITPPLFPGADKVVHALMFGGLEFMICVDRARSKDWKSPSLMFILFTSTIVILFGALIEFLQEAMNMGRSADLLDFIADSIGTLAVALFCLIYKRLFNKTLL